MKRDFARTASNTLDLYCSEIRRFPLLTVAEEQALARACGEGRAASLDRLVTANLRFVLKIVREYRTAGVSLADLVQEGNLGLLRAAQRFDPDRNVRFVTYAAPWIRAQINEYLMKSFSIVKIGTTQAGKRLFFSLARARRDLEARRTTHALDRDGESAELARALNVKPGEVDEMSQRLNGHDLSIDAIESEEAPSRHLRQLVDHRPSQDDALSTAQQQERVHETVRGALSRLDERERFVVERRTMSDVPMTLRDIGGLLRVSSERARQLELRATRKLKRELELDPLADKQRTVG